MNLATRKDDSRDGQLVVVSRDLKHAAMASRITGTLQRALDDWAFMAPQLQDLYDELNHGRAPNSFPFDPDEYLSPLPRAFQRIEAGAYPAYEKRLQKARLVADAPLPEVSPTAILSRDLARVSGWSRNDDALDEESPDDVRTTLKSLRGTDLMEKYKAYLAEQERDHRKLLAAIRRSEEAEVQTSEVVPAPIPDENTDDKPLSYYL